LGGSKRGTCKFWVEHNPKKGYRFCRVTTGKPKTATYGGRGAIVDGSDGRTYLIQFAGVYDFISVRTHDFLSCSSEVHPSGVFPVQAELYAELKALISIVSLE